jgi:hypothetical protein
MDAIFKSIELLGDEAVNVKPRPRLRQPSIKTMEKWMYDGVAKATDGCRVEPDGCCPHGCQSWLLELGYI